MRSKTYTFKAELWKHTGASGWCFVTLPAKVAKEIRSNHFDSEEGWGRLKALASVGDSTWKTAIWYDSKFKSYLLPIKALIRKKEKTVIGSDLLVSLKIE